MQLDSDKTRQLVDLILDSFRVRENHDPIYVEIGDSLKRLSSNQHQVVFGRRGSGKSCLFVHFLRQRESDTNKAVYVSVDAIKRLPFPDILTRILISIFEQLPSARRSWWKRFKTPSKVERTVVELRSLLDQANTAKVERTVKDARAAGAKIGSTRYVNASVESSSESSSATKEEFRREKLEHLERHLDDYKSAIKEALPRNRSFLYVLVDDFYLVSKEIQPDVVDYLHKLLRDTNAYLKLGTIRHRTVLRRHEGQTIGVEVGQDVEEISLDRTLGTFAETQHFLVSMLNELGKRVGIEDTSGQLFNADAAHALTLASGGVPRDFLTIFTDAVRISIAQGKTSRLTPTYVWKAAAQNSLQNKRKNLSEDAGVDADALERAFADIVNFCLQDKKKTAFLVSREDAEKMPSEHELLQQLMDFKLIHLIDGDTSAASGRAGRFSAYVLDASLFMEPRRRGIDHVQFWQQDEQRRPLGVRESPIYPLDRIRNVVGSEPAKVLSLEAVLEGVESEEEMSPQ